jgi:hypothetical protein
VSGQVEVSGFSVQASERMEESDLGGKAVTAKSYMDVEDLEVY